MNVPQELDLVVEAVVHRAHEHPAGLLRRLDHRLGLAPVARHRPLAEHVLAGAERRHRNRRMQMVRRADVDGGDRLVAQDILEIGDHAGDRVLLRHTLQAHLVLVAEDADLDLGAQAEPGRDVRHLGHLSGADDADCERRLAAHRDLPLLCVVRRCQAPAALRSSRLLL